MHYSAIPFVIGCGIGGLSDKAVVILRTNQAPLLFVRQFRLPQSPSPSLRRRKDQLMGWCLALLVMASILSPAMCRAQARALINTSTESIALANVAGQDVVLGSVSLGTQRSFAIFNIQAAGKISPDPDLNNAAFQLEFLICDQPDCGGDVRVDTRVLQTADSPTAARLIATRSFGVSTHSSGQVTMPALSQQNVDGNLYLAAALKSLRNTAVDQFRGKLTLLRVDVMP